MTSGTEEGILITSIYTYLTTRQPSAGPQHKFHWLYLQSARKIFICHFLGSMPIYSYNWPVPGSLDKRFSLPWRRTQETRICVQCSIHTHRQCIPLQEHARRSHNSAPFFSLRRKVRGATIVFSSQSFADDWSHCEVDHAGTLLDNGFGDVLPPAHAKVSISLREEWNVRNQMKVECWM